MSKGWQIALGALLCALLLGWYASNALEGTSFTYYKTLAEFRAAAGSGDAAAPHRARVHGYVTVGSIQRDVEQQAVRFEVQEQPPHAEGAASATLAVEYSSLEVPDLFKDGAEVVVEGRLERRDGREVFRATNVLAKCPSKFEAKSPETTPL